MFSHLYTLILKPDNSYVVKIDNEKVESGTMEEDWDFLAPKTIKVGTQYHRMAKITQQSVHSMIDHNETVKNSLNIL